MKHLVTLLFKYAIQLVIKFNRPLLKISHTDGDETSSRREFSHRPRDLHNAGRESLSQETTWKRKYLSTDSQNRKRKRKTYLIVETYQLNIHVFMCAFHPEITQFSRSIITFNVLIVQKLIALNLLENLLNIIP